MVVVVLVVVVVVVVGVVDVVVIVVATAAAVVIAAAAAAAAAVVGVGTDVEADGARLCVFVCIKKWSLLNILAHSLQQGCWFVFWKSYILMRG